MTKWFGHHAPAMPTDLQAIADPRFILLAWASGLALAAGAVSLAKIVGVGFTWLSGGVAAVIGLAGWGMGGALPSRLALGFALVAVVLAKNKPVAGVLLTLAGVGYLVDAAGLGGWILAATATLALGGITGMMMLAHWYLVDPRLPRSALRALSVAGIIGLAADGAVLLSIGDLQRSGGTIAFLSLLMVSLLLMLGGLGALRYPAYSGVMAATGLSYLAVLTGLGAVFLGRALVAGVGPFGI